MCEKAFFPFRKTIVHQPLLPMYHLYRSTELGRDTTFKFPILYGNKVVTYSKNLCLFAYWNNGSYCNARRLNKCSKIFTCTMVNGHPCAFLLSIVMLFAVKCLVHQKKPSSIFLSLFNILSMYLLPSVLRRQLTRERCCCSCS